MLSFLPSRSFGSSSVTAVPLRAAQIAAIGEVTLDSYSFIPCSLSSTVGPDSTVLGPNTLNNYQPQPYTEGGDAWNRAMSMLNGTYEGANYQVDYGNVLTAMNG